MAAQSNPFDAFDDFASALPVSDPEPPPGAPPAAAAPEQQSNPFGADTLAAFAPPGTAPEPPTPPTPSPTPAGTVVPGPPSSPFDVFGAALGPPQRTPDAAAPQHQSSPFDVFDGFASPPTGLETPPVAGGSVAAALEPQASPFGALDGVAPGPPPTTGTVAPAPPSPFDAFGGFASPVSDAGLPSSASVDSSAGGEDLPFDLWAAPRTPTEEAGDVPPPLADQEGLVLIDSSSDLDKSDHTHPDKSELARAAKKVHDTAVEGIGWGGTHGPTAYRDEVNRKNHRGRDQSGDAGDPHPDICPPPPLKKKARRKSEMLSLQKQEEAKSEILSPRKEEGAAKGGETKAAIVSALPDCEKVTHSGLVLGRLSATSVRMRSWKQVFWIQHGPTAILFFRNFADYESWLYNPYLSQSARNNLVKLGVDFSKDVNRQLVTGYQVTELKTKKYGKTAMNHFKLERWTDAGATAGGMVIAGAFAANLTELAASKRTGSSVTNDVVALRKIMVACMRRARASATLINKTQGTMTAEVGEGKETGGTGGKEVKIQLPATKGDLKNVERQKLVGMKIAKSKSGRVMNLL